MDIQVFSDSGWEVRAVEKNGEPWFIAKDVAKALGLSNPTVAVGALDADEVAKLNLGGLSGEVNIVSESGLYTLVLRCRDAVTPGTDPHRFRKWITSEVLPAIRKGGAYLTNGMTTRLQSLPAELSAAKEIIEFFGVTGNQALLAANTVVKKLHGVDCMETVGITHLIAEKQVQYFTPTIIGKPHGLSAIKVNKALAAAGFQTERRDHKNRIVWEATEAGMKYCQLLDTNKKHSDGTPIMQIKWRADVMEVI